MHYSVHALQHNKRVIGDHLLTALELGIEMVQSDIESHRGETWRGNKEGSEVERQVATFFDNDTVNLTVSRTTANNGHQQPQGPTTAATPNQGQQPPS